VTSIKPLTNTHEGDCIAKRTGNVRRRKSLAVLPNLAQSGAVINDKGKVLLKKHEEE
jgi:hypothetical protein